MAWVENGTKTKISVRTPQNDKLVAVASVSHKDFDTKQWLIKNNVQETTSIGSSVKFCLVASGQADVYPRFGQTMEWDTAAGHAILIHSGGFVTTHNEETFLYGKKKYKNLPLIAKRSSNLEI